MKTIRRTYKFRLYTSKKNCHLHDAINVAGIIWNHCVALQRRYYHLTGQYISKYRLQKHIAKLRKRRFAFWQNVGSQAVQNIVERLDNAYKKFFKKQGGRPSFQKVKTYRSFTLKQAGWKLLDGNQIRINHHIFKFVKSREIRGKIKTVTIKRDATGKLWLCLSVVEEIEIPERVTSGETVGLDFGLKTFLTTDAGIQIDSPLFFARGRREIARLSKQLSRKRKGSNNRRKARLQLAKAHQRIANQRSNFHWQLAHEL